MTSKTYAGIGSRETPTAVCQQMTMVAERLQEMGYTLFSGGAGGADLAFERGAGDLKKIFVPWEGFNGSKTGIVPPPADEFVDKFHPAPSRLSPAARKLMSRNTYQVLGEDLKSPVDFVLCWTKDGKASGGTGQALRLAKHYRISDFNFNGEYDKILTMLNTLEFLS